MLTARSYENITFEMLLQLPVDKLPSACKDFVSARLLKEKESSSSSSSSASTSLASNSELTEIMLTRLTRSFHLEIIIERLKKDFVNEQENKQKPQINVTSWPEAKKKRLH